MKREIPILFDRKEDCCGCTACYSVCPSSAIRMIEDEEGFLYPRINGSICIGCEKCIKVCPIKQKHVQSDKKMQENTLGGRKCRFSEIKH